MRLMPPFVVSSLMRVPAGLNVPLNGRYQTGGFPLGIFARSCVKTRVPNGYPGFHMEPDRGAMKSAAH